MSFRQFFKLPQYNVFDYKPRFYNPEKDAREERRRELREEHGKSHVDIETQDYKPGSTIKGSFRPKMPRRSFSSKSSTIRVFVIMAVLFFLAYILLMVDLTSLIKYLSN